MLINFLKDWSFLNKNFATFIKYYPNLALLIRLLPKGKCYFYNGEITFQAEYADFSHFMEKEDSYNFVKSFIWNIFKKCFFFFINYFITHFL